MQTILQETVPAPKSVESVEKTEPLGGVATESESSISADDNEDFAMRPAFNTYLPANWYSKDKTIQRTADRQDSKQADSTFFEKRNFRVVKQEHDNDNFATQ